MTVLRVTLLNLLFVALCTGKTITVNYYGGADYVDLAIAANEASAGDTILVADGEYGGHISITKPLTVLGSGPDKCSIIGCDNVMGIHSEDGKQIDGFIKIDGFKFKVQYMMVRAVSIYIYNCSPEITNNDFFGVGGICRAIEIAGYSSPAIHYNNFEENPGPAIEVRGSMDVDGENNWWGTTNPVDIQNIIMDGNDTEGMGIVDFEPYLLQAYVDRPQVSREPLDTFSLFPNYPNPFNASTVISYVLNKDGYVRLEVANLNGQWMDDLVNEYQKRGHYQIRWDGTNNMDQNLSSGTYVMRLMSNEMIRSRLVTLLK